MKVLLLQSTFQPEHTVALAARLCYSPLEIEELLEKLTEEKRNDLIRKIISIGHFSVLEHASFTFGIEGISRATSHQLVRHRIASYSQQSQRYVKQKEQFQYVIPHTIAEKPSLKKHFEGLMQEIQGIYDDMLGAGIPPEDARFVLPNSAATKIIVTMNARELHHFFKLRCCNRAQWEIREMAIEMLRLALCKASILFTTAGPSCVRGPCTEGKMTCGKKEEVREFFQKIRKEAVKE